MISKWPAPVKQNQPVITHFSKLVDLVQLTPILVEVFELKHWKLLDFFIEIWKLFDQYQHVILINPFLKLFIF